MTSVGPARGRRARRSWYARSSRAIRPYHTMKRLVILAPNWLGDAVMALPAIADVRRAAPGAPITVAARAVGRAAVPASCPRSTRRSCCRGRPAMHDVRALARARRRAGRRRVRRGAAAAELDARRAARVARRHSRALGLPHRLARPSADARDRRAPPGVHQVDVVPAARARARLSERPERAARRRAAGRARDAARAAADGATGGTAARRSSRSRRARRTAARSAGRRRTSRELAAALAADGVGCVMVGSAADAATGGRGRARVAARRPRARCINLVGRTDLPTLAGVLHALPRAGDERLRRDAPGRGRRRQRDRGVRSDRRHARRGRSATRTRC